MDADTPDVAAQSAAVLRRDGKLRLPFRLPFKVGKTGVPEKPERGQNAYYLGDDGSLIGVHRQNEFALKVPAPDRERADDHRGNRRAHRSDGTHP